MELICCGLLHCMVSLWFRIRKINRNLKDDNKLNFFVIGKIKNGISLEYSQM